MMEVDNDSFERKVYREQKEPFIDYNSKKFKENTKINPLLYGLKKESKNDYNTSETHAEP